MVGVAIFNCSEDINFTLVIDSINFLKKILDFRFHLKSRVNILFNF